MPKKQPKNAYFFYMLHFKDEEARKGRFFAGGLPEISIAASASWKNMTAQQRGPYEKKAKDHKVGPQKEVEKYTSQGIPLSMIKKEEQMLNMAQKTMKATIKEIVQNSYTNNTMGSQEYFFVSGNYFIKTDDNYFPAELAIIKFTFDYGIVNKFHTYINPEKLPLGFQYDAKSWSEESHRLPIPPNAKGEKNYGLVLHEINKFMGNGPQLPPLFTRKEDVAMIESFMQEFCALSDEDPTRYRVYPLHQLFFDIKEEAVKNSIDGESFHSIHIAEAHLNRDHYAYLRDTACNYHEEIDCAKYCALSVVQRWAYTFADHICLDLNIALVPGQHFPPEVDVAQANAGSTFSETTYNDTSNVDDTMSQISSSVVSTDRFARRAPSPQGRASTSNDDHRWGRRPPSPKQRTSTSNDNRWAARPPSPQQKTSSSTSNDEDFPSLGSHNRKASSSKKRAEQQRDYNNPWNTSTSSNDSNPWNDRQTQSDFRPKGRGSDSLISMKSTASRGLGRGSELYRSKESHIGHNDDRPERNLERKKSGSSHWDRRDSRDRSKRYHPWKSERKDDRDAKRK